MTTENRKTRKTVNLSENAHEAMAAYAREKQISITQIIETMLEWLPVYEECAKQSLSVEDACKKIASVAIVETSEKPVSNSKTKDKFSYWLEKIYAHNLNSELVDRVYVTQRLLLNLTNGNVNMISAAFKARMHEIELHNAKMQVNETTNRKLSSRIRAEYGTVADWLMKIATK